MQILLVHEASKGSFSRVFDFEANDLSEDEGDARTSPFESRFPINIGITGYVATTGEVSNLLFSKCGINLDRNQRLQFQTVNIGNAYEDDRFDPSVDEGQSFRHKTILCMAIKNSLGQIIGVIQLINKFDELVSIDERNLDKHSCRNTSFLRILPKTMKTSWKPSPSSAEWAFTIHTCTKKQS